MLILDAVIHDPLAAAAMEVFGVVILVIIAAIAASLWVVVALGRARREARDFDDSANDPQLEALRRDQLVVRGKRQQRGQPDAIVTQLEKGETPGGGPRQAPG